MSEGKGVQLSKIIEEYKVKITCISKEFFCMIGISEKCLKRLITRKINEWSLGEDKSVFSE